MQGELAIRKSELREKEIEVKGLKERLALMLQSRGELDSLKVMLRALKKEEEEREDSEDDEEEEDEEEEDNDNEDDEEEEGDDEMGEEKGADEDARIRREKDRKNIRVKEDEETEKTRTANQNKGNENKGKENKERETDRENELLVALSQKELALERAERAEEIIYRLQSPQTPTTSTTSQSPSFTPSYSHPHSHTLTPTPLDTRREDLSPALEGLSPSILQAMLTPPTHTGREESQSGVTGPRSASGSGSGSEHYSSPRALSGGSQIDRDRERSSQGGSQGKIDNIIVDARAGSPRSGSVSGASGSGSKLRGQAATTPTVWHTREIL